MIQHNNYASHVINEKQCTVYDKSASTLCYIENRYMLQRTYTDHTKIRIADVYTLPGTGQPVVCMYMLGSI